MYGKIVETIKSAIAGYEKNNKPDYIWKEPIIEIISAQNEALDTLKYAVSPEHLMPSAILADAKSIISFFLPFDDRVVKSNIGGIFASREWAKCYIQTNDLIKTINDEIEILMKKNGYKTGKIPATHNFDVEKLISNWSHRHIAYIAGMGTFGINNMLITKSGCCGRFGSIIINYEFEKYDEKAKPEEKCLYKARRGADFDAGLNRCGICQTKCKTNALENNVFNRKKCYEQCLKNAEQHKSIGYADVCGKCLAGLPCSIKDPSAPAVSESKALKESADCTNEHACSL